jgi:hypothetical protein
MAENLSLADGISNYITSTDVFTTPSDSDQNIRKFIVQIQAIFIM